MSFDKKIELGGWALFIVSSFFYGAANLINGQWLSLGGSISFLLACVVFVVLRLNQPD